jgi:RimJ/RimL family protein N-acetyltransferase
MLKTKQVMLRPLDEGDMTQTRAWRNDPATRDAMLSHRLPVTTAMEARWFRSVLDGKRSDEVHFAIADPRNGTCLGLISLREIDPFARAAWVSILVGDTARRGQGVGGDSLDLLLGYAGDTLGLRKLGARLAAFNKASRRLFISRGFKQEGRLKEQIFSQGGFHDLLLLGRFL